MRLTRRDAVAGLATAGLASAKSGFAQPETPRRGGTLNVMVALDVKSLDPLFGNSGVDRKIFNLYAECLLFQDETSELRPWLAERWEVADGGRTVTFHLRRDVTFQDGTRLDAAAAKFNLDRLLDPKTIPYPRQFVREFQAAEVIDDYTVRTHLASPSVMFLPMMAAEAGAMMSPTAIKAMGENFARKPVGTGPFRVVSRGSDEIVTERSGNYWRNAPDGKPLPYLDGVRIVINPNSSVRLLQLESGSAQLCDPVSAKDFAHVRASPGLTLLDTPLGVAFVISFNVTRPPLDNIDLRRALSLAIDREAFVKVITLGNGVALKGIEPPQSWVYDPTLRGHVYDPVAARAAYVKSGHSGPLTFTIVQRDPDTQIAEMMQQMYRRIGVDLHIEAMERLAYFEKVLAFNTDLSMAQTPLQRQDVDTQYTLAYSRTASSNFGGVKDERLFSLCDQAHVELDRAKRKALYVQIQQLILDNYYLTYLFWNPTREVAARRLQGIRHDGTNIWLYDQMWLA
jgi:peptide/nickel transport system substrate-binding protein